MEPADQKIIQESTADPFTFDPFIAVLLSLTHKGNFSKVSS